jgi:hypothetical protein
MAKSRNRLVAEFVRNISADATITSDGLDTTVRSTLEHTFDSADITSLISSNTSPGVSIETSLDALANTDGLEPGTQKYISEANRLFIWNGSSWENISLTNNPPVFDANGEADSDYSLARDGTPTVIDLGATDPEGVPLIWTYSITDGTLGNTATIEQDSADSSIFTITPSLLEDDAGNFQVTFSGSDGKNIINTVANFRLNFPIIPDEVIYTSGTHTFTVPDNVYNLSVVLVGGGGSGAYQLNYQSNGGRSSFGVSGQSFYFYANGGGGGSGSSGGSGGTRGGAYDGGGNGGAGSNGSSNSGGGGAGGYSGNGGSSVGASGASAGPGGGVGIGGQGLNGAGASTNYGTANSGSGGGGGAGGACSNYSCGSNIYGYAGSGGAAYGLSDPFRTYREKGYGGAGPSAGGGGGGGAGALAYKNNIAVTPGQQITVTVGAPGGGGSNSYGASGVVRIIWPADDDASGLIRAFPSTNVGPSGSIVV